MKKMIELTSHIDGDVCGNGLRGIIIGCHTCKSLSKMRSLQGFDEKRVKGSIAITFVRGVHQTIDFFVD